MRRLWRFLLLAAGMAAATAEGRPGCLPAETVAPGVLVVRGSGGEPRTAERGRAANTVLLVGSRGITIIDPGPSVGGATALRCTLRRFGGKPVVALINTHPHPENVLANAAFPEAPVHATAEAAIAMRERCAACQRRLEDQLGTAEMARTRPRIPDRTVAAPTDLDAGGRKIRLLPLGNAHSRGDLAVLDLASRTLIGGDVVTSRELPDLRDGNVSGWLAALDLLAAQEATRIVPGRGAATATGALARIRSYLVRLAGAAEAAAESGEWPPRLADEEGLAGEFDRFAELHPLNLQRALREAETAWWQRQPAAGPESGGAAR